MNDTSIDSPDVPAAAHGSPGAFAGIDVHRGPGGGLASGAPVPVTGSTHFHAARLPDLGDVVLAVTRIFDPETVAARRLELRAFAASAPGRGSLASMPADALLEAPGAIAYAALELAAAGDSADERRAATLERCAVTDAAPTDAAARGVADWLRTTWETELAFGSWPAVRGSLAAFALGAGGSPASWASAWLEATEHHVGDEIDPQFVKVLATAWLEQSDAAAADLTEAASTS